MNVQSPCTYGRSNDISYVHASDLHSVTCIARCFVNVTLNDGHVFYPYRLYIFIMRPLSIDVLSEGRTCFYPINPGLVAMATNGGAYSINRYPIGVPCARPDLTVVPVYLGSPNCVATRQIRIRH